MVMMQRLNMSEAHCTLGFHLAPNGNNEEEYPLVPTRHHYTMENHMVITKIPQVAEDFSL